MPNPYEPPTEEPICGSATTTEISSQYVRNLRRSIIAMGVTTTIIPVMSAFVTDRLRIDLAALVIVWVGMQLNKESFRSLIRTVVFCLLLCGYLLRYVDGTAQPLDWVLGAWGLLNAIFILQIHRMHYTSSAANQLFSD